MNPTNIVLWPYKMGSAAGKMMAQELGVKRVFSDKNYIPKAGHLVINWGCGFMPTWPIGKVRFLNHPAAIETAVSKIESFYAFKEAGVSTPVWTQYKEWSSKWIKNGEWAVCRTQVEGFDGSGIVLAKTLEELPDCNLYTKYVPIDHEFRIYVVGDQVVDCLDKKRKVIDEAHPHIRTETNGWVFCQNPKFVPDDAKVEAIKAVKALKLDFGGVDVIFNKEKNKSFVLEVNTAPGIYGNTVPKMKDAMLKYIEGL